MPEGDYDIAVFEKLFPSMNLDSTDAPKISVETKPAKGVCEIIVFTKNPDLSLGRLPLDRIELSLEVLTDRTKTLGANPEIKYVLAFDNRGVEQGVTLHHPHGQLYAYPFVPPIPAQFLKSLKEYHEQHHKGLMQSLIEAERKDQNRVIVKNEDTIAFIPAFASYPYETWIAPLRPVNRWSQSSRSTLAFSNLPASAHTRSIKIFSRNRIRSRNVRQ